MTPVKYKHDIQWLICIFEMLKNEENNGIEEIGLVTPTPGPLGQDMECIGSILKNDWPC